MRLSRIFGWLIVVLVAYFFGAAMIANWEQVSRIDVSITLTAVLVTLLFAVAVMISGGLWSKVFAAISGRKVEVTEAVRCHLASWLLKYIPGQVGGLIYKIRWAEKQGAGKSLGALAYGYELLFLTLSSTLVAIPVLIVTAAQAYAATLLLAYLGVLVLVVVLAQRAPHELARRIVRRLSGREPGSQVCLSLLAIIGFSGWYMLPRLLNGVAFVVLADSLLPVTPDQYLLLGAAYILAGIVGIYAVFVPSGIGVREAVIVAFASIAFPLEQAIVLSLAGRLYATAADGLLGLGFLILNRLSAASSSVEEKS